MKAVRLYAANDLRVEDISLPGLPKENEVLIKVIYAGICGSDIHNFLTGSWISRSPTTPGHEFSGKIIECGINVKNLKVGDIVIADSRISCEDCFYCNSNKNYLCENLGFVGELNDGGFAPYTIQKESQLLKVNNSIHPNIAVMSEPLAVALHAIRKFDVNEHERALILGAGPIGVLSAICLKNKGLKSVFISDTNQYRLKKVCFDFDLFPLESKIQYIKESKKPSFCIDATNSNRALETILSLIAKGGTVSMIGLNHKPTNVQIHKIVESGITLSGCAAFDSELNEALLLMPKIQVYLKKLSVNPIHILETPEYYTKLIEGSARDIKILINLN